MLGRMNAHVHSRVARALEPNTPVLLYIVGCVHSCMLGDAGFPRVGIEVQNADVHAHGQFGIW